MVKDVFAKRLKELRNEKGYSQATLAKMLDISSGSISYYEAAERTPDIETFYKVSQLFDVDCNYLLGVSDIKKDTKDGNKLATLVDVIRFSESLGAKLSVECERTRGSIKKANISFTDKKICEFITEYIQIKFLSIDKDMKEKLMNLWIKDKTKELENVNYKKWDGAKGYKE